MAPMSNKERASLGGQALHAKRSPAERSAAAGHAYLTGAAKTVITRWAEIPAELQARIRETVNA